MKQIQPVSIWYNGLMVAATVINMSSVNDNLIDSANFLYELYNENIIIAFGNLTMTGADYITYSTSIDSNDYAYTWGAAQLNITLI